MKHCLVLVHLCTKFKLDKSKFAQIGEFSANFQKIQNLKISERFNRLWRNSLPKVLYRYIINERSFTAIAQVSHNLELTQTFKNKNFMKIVTNIGA